MVFAVVPTDQFLIVPETTLRMFRLFTLLFDLCQYPASGNNGMGFQKFSWRTGIHLRSNHARQILFKVYMVDCYQTFFRGSNFECSLEALVFLLLPMKIYTDGYGL